MENFQIIEEKEKKVIRLGSVYQKLKGYLIKEASEGERNAFNRPFVTYPVVSDGWRVAEIGEPIESLVIGKEGDIVPLWAASNAIQQNATDKTLSLSDILVNLESLGITVSNRIAEDSPNEYPDEITVVIDGNVLLSPAGDNYFVPVRQGAVFAGELYQVNDDFYKNPNGWSPNVSDRLVKLVADDIFALSWFFNKKLKVRVRARVETRIGDIPEDWVDCIQRFEKDVNAEVREIRDKYPDAYFTGKRKDVFDKNKKKK